MTALTLQLFMNGLNIALNILLVVGFNQGVSGVAAGTLIAEISAAGLGAFLALRHVRLGGSAAHWTRARILDAAQIARMIAVNRDIMLRTDRKSTRLNSSH